MHSSPSSLSLRHPLNSYKNGKHNPLNDVNPVLQRMQYPLPLVPVEDSAQFSNGAGIGDGIGIHLLPSQEGIDFAQALHYAPFPRSCENTQFSTSVFFLHVIVGV